MNALDINPIPRKRGLGSDNWTAPKCGAKTRAGGQCQQPAMENGRCRLHGGKTPVGIASPQFKNGRYTKMLKNTTLADAYEAALRDPDLLDLSNEVALLQVRLQSIMGQLETQDSAGRWQAAQNALQRYKLAAAHQDEYEWRIALNDLDDAIRDGGKESLVWDDFLKTLKSYTDVVAKEQKRRLDMNALISVDQAVGFAAELLYAVRDNVSDQRALTAIHDKISDALNRRPNFAAALEMQRADQERINR